MRITKNTASQLNFSAYFNTPDVLTLFSGYQLTKDPLYYLQERFSFGSAGEKQDAKQGKYSRTYSFEDLDKLSTILQCTAAGFSLDEIHKNLNSSRRPWCLLPPGRLTQLMAAARQMRSMASLFESKEEVYKSIAGAIRSVLGCEASSLVLTLGTPPELKKVASDGYTVQAADEFTLATDGASLRAFGEDIVAAVGTFQFPPDQRRFTSMLQLPLIDRKRQRLGFVRAWFRRKFSGQEGELSIFDLVDEAVGVLLAEEISAVLQALNITDASCMLMETVLTTPNLIGNLNKLLRQAKDVLGADRGNLFWLEDSRKQLRMVARVGDSTLEAGQPLPEPSISAAVFRRREAKVVPDVSADPEYHRGCLTTQSEIATPLLNPFDPKAEPMAILNLESDRLGFFDEQDRLVLRHLTGYAALAAQFTGALEEIYRCMTEVSNEEVVDDILESVERGIGFDQGVVFIADYRRAVLRSVASRPKTRRRPDERPFEYRFDEKAFAVQLFTTRAAAFSDDPWKDTRFSSEGLTRFDVRGPVLGVPLMFGPIPVGALVVWGKKTRSPKLQDREALEQHARLAVTTIAISASELRRHQAFILIEEILTHMQGPETDTDEILIAILNGVVNAGFDRARVFRYVENWNGEGAAFVCFASFGGGKPNGLRDKPILISGCKYAEWTLKDIELGNFEPKIRIPSGEPEDEDPNAEKLGKPPKLPWAVAALKVREVRAYIAADCALTQNEIAPSSLEYLALYGALAALVIANQQNTFEEDERE